MDNSTPKLFWNREGEVRCEFHAPSRLSDTWKREGWIGLSQDELDEWFEELGETPICECGGCNQ